VPADPRAPEPLVELGSIEIPKIGVSKSMFEGITLTTLDHGPGHWPGTAMPGHVGNVVIAGHRVSHDKPFRHLEQLEVGDDVILTTDEGRFVYKVTGTEVVYPDALWIADQTADYTATLFACHPAGSTRQRIVVHLALAPNG
jgi:sortase A